MDATQSTFETVFSVLAGAATWILAGMFMQSLGPLRPPPPTPYSLPPSPILDVLPISPVDSSACNPTSLVLIDNSTPYTSETPAFQSNIKAIYIGAVFVLMFVYYIAHSQPRRRLSLNQSPYKLRNSSASPAKTNGSLAISQIQYEELFGYESGLITTMLSSLEQSSPSPPTSSSLTRSSGSKMKVSASTNTLSMTDEAAEDPFEERQPKDQPSGSMADVLAELAGHPKLLQARERYESWEAAQMSLRSILKSRAFNAGTPDNGLRSSISFRMRYNVGLSPETPGDKQRRVEAEKEKIRGFKGNKAPSPQSSQYEKENIPLPQPLHISVPASRIPRYRAQKVESSFTVTQKFLPTPPLSDDKRQNKTLELELAGLRSCQKVRRHGSISASDTPLLALGLLQTR